MKPLVKRRKKKAVRPSEHRVYCTYFPDGRYYIGYSCKPQRQWEKYWGSSREIKEYTTNTPIEQQALKKELIVTYKNKNQAKLQEMLLQLQHRYDDNCINDMIHIRLRLKYLTDFEPIDWEPSSYDTIEYQ